MLNSPEKFAHMCCFNFIRLEKKKNCYWLSTIASKQNSRVQEVHYNVNISKIKFEPNDDLVDQAFPQFNENAISINNQDPHSQTDNDETLVAEYPNGNKSKCIVTRKKCCNFQFYVRDINR